MKINDLMARLISIQKDYGNVPVVLSTDSEGNSYGTLNENGSLRKVMVMNDKGIKVVGICLYPFEEGFYDVIEAVQADRS